MLTTWLLSGCQGLGAQPTNVPLNLTAFLPPEWQPVGELYEIDVDEDAVTEYLLLYTYDQTNGSGPVGALIFDPQVEAVVGDGGRLVTGRPAGSPNPYAILPNYWGGAGQGFIAAPSQKESVTVRQVAHQPILSVEQAPKPDVLVLRGGNNYLTFVWWKNVVEGYGVTQLHAPGWFAGIDWAAWDALPQPIQTIVGLEPANDRSQICHQTQHTLVEIPAEELEQGVFRQAIRYRASDLGIAFCFGSPAHPFYPEGVVLAYLTDGGKREQMLLDTVRNDAAERARLTDLFNPDLLVRVDEVLGYPTIPLTVADALRGANAVRTTVCAQLLLRQSADSTEVEPRWLLFTLEHRPPQLQPPTPDRLYIANINAIPTPAEGVGVRCRDMIDVNN
jgi:hypothetical protein